MSKLSNGPRLIYIKPVVTREETEKIKYTTEAAGTKAFSSCKLWVPVDFDPAGQVG